MRKWYVPLTLMGLGSLGVFFMTERGRGAARWLYENLHDPGKLMEWNEAAQRELERIQVALNRVAATLESAQTQSRLA
jgi:hypothetical protein